ncbi:MAG: DNA-processing protein DprA [Spirochaetaceae bacterium]|nr:MAG: DNA-processing protein DprA [Spirochaetaceae bacterium]
MAPSEQLALAVNRIPYLRPLEKFRVMARCPEAARLARLQRRDMERMLQRRFDDPGCPMASYLAAAETDRKDLTRGRFQCTFYWNRGYPPQLREVYDPPLVLYHRGELPDWSRPLVAIVGTRHPTGQGRESSYALAFELARYNLATVSGMARGIDAEAHRGSCEAGGRSIAVLGNGVDILFPHSSVKVGRSLLAAGGVLLSEYPPGDPPLARNFPARNRIISGLARTIVVVQAPLRSGALITADYALEQGRDLVVHRVGTTGERGLGSLKLVEQGAGVIEGAPDILADWGWARTEGSWSRTESFSTGEQLALALEAQMAGRMVLRSGRVYERHIDGNE